MAAERRSRPRTSPPRSFSPEQYASFIGQIELDAIWLARSRVENHAGLRSPRHAEVGVSESAQWQPADDGFDIQHQYMLHFHNAGQELAVIDVTFGLHFTSHQPMTDETFEVFRAVNLPVNTWPYLRAYVADTTGRFGWLPFTLPALKRGATNDAATDDTTADVDAARSPRSRSASSKSRRGSASRGSSASTQP